MRAIWFSPNFPQIVISTEARSAQWRDLHLGTATNLYPAFYPPTGGFYFANN